MKREKSSSHRSASKGPGVAEINVSPSGSLPKPFEPTPCTGPATRNARHSLPLERLGFLLQEWLESLGYKRMFPEPAEELSEDKLLLSVNQLREIDQRIASFKTKASRSRHLPESVILDNVDLIRLLHISPRTSRLWREKGWINYSRVGKKIFFRLEDVERMIDSCRVVKNSLNTKT